MKATRKIMLTALFLIAVIAASATTSQNADTTLTPSEKYFIGKWKLNVYGLPQGDAKMLMVIEKVDGKLQGTLGGEKGENPNKFTKVEIKGNTLNVRFMGGGWDVPMYLDKKDEKKITGSMNDMFDVDGTKIVEDAK
ncbi:MAG: hypothetical protein Q8909_10915 [Bacteroidota bacterium]|nr:hypothetical protein [Bacteroidota bacterium]